MLKALSRVLIVLSLSGCSLARYKPVDTQLVGDVVPMTPGTVTLLFEPLAEGKSLSQTVWDSAIGPIWDPRESELIGFTQNYKVPPEMFMGVAGGASTQAVAIGRAAGGQASAVDSRIMIPFGRLLTQNVAEYATRAGLRVTSCFDSACAQTQSQTDPSGQTLGIRVDSFSVREATQNHLTLQATVTCSHARRGETSRPVVVERVYSNKSIGSTLSTHAQFLKSMNALSSEFSSDVAGELVRRCLSAG